MARRNKRKQTKQIKQHKQNGPSGRKPTKKKQQVLNKQEKQKLEMLRRKRQAEAVHIHSTILDEDVDVPPLARIWVFFSTIGIMGLCIALVVFTVFRKEQAFIRTALATTLSVGLIMRIDYSHILMMDKKGKGIVTGAFFTLMLTCLGLSVVSYYGYAREDITVFLVLTGVMGFLTHIVNVIRSRGYFDYTAYKGLLEKEKNND